MAINMKIAKLYLYLNLVRINKMNKPLTSTEKSVLFRHRNKELGRSEMRGIMATKEEQLILKKLCRDKLKCIRKDS